VLERRLNRMSNSCQLLLGKAAVLGGSFELNQLQPMATEHDEDSILDLLEEALRAGLLTEEVAGNSIIYHFWHPLIINHLYSRLSAARRAQLHRKAAEAIKTAYPAQAEKAAAIVYHLSKGSGDVISVAYYAEQAGNQAYSLAAYSEAQQYYLQALYALIKNEVYIAKNSQTSPHIHLIIVPPPAQLSISDPLRVSRLLERVGECGMVAGNFADARQVFECLLELRTSQRFQQQVYGSSPSKEELHQEAQIQALLWREVSIIWATTGEYEHAHTSYQQGKEILIGADITTGAAWAGLHRQYAAKLRQEGRYHEARRFLQEALEMLEHVVQQHRSIITYTEQTMRNGTSSQARPHNDLPTRTERILNGDPREIGFAHEGLGIVAASLGQLDEAVQQLHIALASYEQSELVSEMAQVCSNLGSVYMTKGEYEAARIYMHRSLNLAERAGDLPNMAFVMLNLGEVAHRSGDLMEAEGLFKQSMTLAEQTNYREGISWCSAMLSATYKAQGDLHNAAKSIIHAIKTGRMIKNTRCIRFALIGLADLRIAQAMTVEQQTFSNAAEGDQRSNRRERLLLRAQTTLQRTLTLEGMEVEHIIDGNYSLACVYFLLGDLEAAQHTAWHTHEEAQKYEITNASERIYRLLGRIQAAQKNYQQAGEYFEQAMQLCRERDFKLDYARTLHVYGAMLIQHKQTRQKGLEYLYAAQEIFATSHAAFDLRLLEQDLTRLEPDLAV
jgi:tetratricopeptide (TPR) repeat protein